MNPSGIITYFLLLLLTHPDSRLWVVLAAEIPESNGHWLTASLAHVLCQNRSVLSLLFMGIFLFNYPYWRLILACTVQTKQMRHFNYQSCFCITKNDMQNLSKNSNMQLEWSSSIAVVLHMWWVFTSVYIHCLHYISYGKVANGKSRYDYLTG